MNATQITIIDYGLGNIGSVANAFEYLGYRVRYPKTSQAVKEADAIVLPE